MRSRTILIGGVLTLLLAAPSAGAHRRSGTDSGAGAAFAGSCQLTGTVRFVPPLTNSPEPTRDEAIERGTCSGTLTARGQTIKLNDAPVRYHAIDDGQLGSCGGSPNATGRGRLHFRGATISFALSESRVSGVAKLSLTGSRSGTAQGVASISSSANPVQIAQQCAGGGLRSVAVDISLQTTPEISG